MRASVEDRLVGLACGVADRRTRDAPAMHALSARVEQHRLLAVLDRHQLTALIGTRLDALGALPAGLRPDIEARLQNNRMRALLFDHSGRLVLDALEGEGIPALAFKGFALAAAVYDDAGFRRYGDIDVLVPASALTAAVTALEPLGYLGVPERQAAGVPNLHLRAQDIERRLPLVELHWRVHWFESEFSRDMLSRSVVSGGRRVATLADELAALLLIYARDGFRGLRLVADLAAWWDAHGAELPLGALDELRRRHPELGPVWATALVVGERVAGLPASRVMSDLSRDHRDRLAERLANWPGHGTPDQAGADLALIDSLLAPRGQIAATMRRYLLPPAAVLDDFYGLSADERLLRAGWRVMHPPKLLGRYAIGLWRARSPLRSPGHVKKAVQG